MGELSLVKKGGEKKDYISHMGQSHYNESSGSYSVASGITKTWNIPLSDQSNNYVSPTHYNATWAAFHYYYSYSEQISAFLLPGNPVSITFSDGCVLTVELKTGIYNSDNVWVFACSFQNNTSSSQTINSIMLNHIFGRENI